MAKGRVIITPQGFISQSLDWSERVQKPFQEGRIVEAFASADALIDASTDSLLRHIYSDFNSQDLINEIQLLRGRVNFDGIILLEILKSKTVVDEALVGKVRNFKKARNLVVHNPEGEYKLVLGNQELKYSTQDELDTLTLAESRKWLSQAFEAFLEFERIFRSIDPAYYLSTKFYEKNPRGKVAQKQYPKPSK